MDERLGVAVEGGVRAQVDGGGCGGVAGAVGLEKE